MLHTVIPKSLGGCQKDSSCIECNIPKDGSPLERRHTTQDGHFDTRVKLT